MIRQKDAVVPALLPALISSDPALRRNAAIALGAVGMREALPVLRETVRERNDYHFLDCRRSNQFPGVTAVCLIGRLGGAEDLSLLGEIVFDPAEFDRPFYHRLPPDYIYCDVMGCHFLFFQYFTHAAAAMMKIAARQGCGETAALKKRLAARFSGASREELIRQVASRDGKESPVFAEELSSFMDTVLA